MSGPTCTCVLCWTWTTVQPCGVSARLWSYGRRPPPRCQWMLWPRRGVLYGAYGASECWRPPSESWQPGEREYRMASLPASCFPASAARLRTQRCTHAAWARATCRRVWRSSIRVRVRLVAQRGYKRAVPCDVLHLPLKSSSFSETEDDQTI